MAEFLEAQYFVLDTVSDLLISQHYKITFSDKLYISEIYNRRQITRKVISVHLSK